MDTYSSIYGDYEADWLYNYYYSLNNTNYNVSNLENRTNLIELEKTISTLSTALYSIAFFVGVIGNGIVIWIAGHKMKNISSVWFLNMAIVDFMCCASLPLRIIEWNLDRTNHYSHDLCKISTSVLNITMGTSVNFLTAMSIDRFVSVMWPFWSKIHRTRRNACVTSFYIWILSLFLTAPFVLLNNFYDDVSDCLFKDASGNKTYRFSMHITKFVISFAAPFFIILFCYGGVLLQIKKAKINKKTFRPYRIITAVIGCFFISGFPYHTWRLMPVLSGKQRSTDFILYNTFTCLAYLNSCTNPILYVIIGENFKISFKPSVTEMPRSLSGKMK